MALSSRGRQRGVGEEGLSSPEESQSWPASRTAALSVPPTLLRLRKQPRGKGGCGRGRASIFARLGTHHPDNCRRFVRGSCRSCNLHFILWIYICFLHFSLFPQSYFWYKCFF